MRYLKVEQAESLQECSIKMCWLVVESQKFVDVEVMKRGNECVRSHAGDEMKWCRSLHRVKAQGYNVCNARNLWPKG